MTKRKPTRKRKPVPRKRRPSKRRIKKRTIKRKAKKKPFGGYNLNFTDCHETLEQVFGKKPITPSQMTKKIWNYIKYWGLGDMN